MMTGPSRQQLREASQDVARPLHEFLIDASRRSRPDRGVGAL